MPVIEGAATDRHRLVRNIRVVRGVMRFAIEIQPRFDYGRGAHKLEITEHGGVFASGGMELTVHGIAAEGASAAGLGIAPERAGDGVRWTRTLREGEIGGVVLESMGGAPRWVSPEEAQQLADDTARFWRGWLARSTYTGRWREMVNRSAMTLKLLTYAPTGAPVAAPTTGLPEQAGGERNWDYRYTWIRDGSFSIYALLGLGYVDEAAAFGGWLRDRAAEQAGKGSGPLKIMYRVDGTPDLVEESLDHWEGGRGSRPVRIGNGAADQLQLDIYGEAADAIFLADSSGIEPGHQGWAELAGIIDWLCEHWDQPDEGIWETRGGQKNFTYGRFRAWVVALDRAIRLAARRGRPASITRWMTERDAIYQQIMERGWNPKVGAFTQHYDTEVLNATTQTIMWVVIFFASAGAALALVGVRTLGHAHSPAPATRPHPTSRIITSRHYRYAEALPAGWRPAGQATQQWDGTGSPGDYDPQSDLFLGPGGVEAWAYAAPTRENLAACTRTVIQASNEHLLRPDIYEHGTPPCPQQPGGQYIYNPRNDLWFCNRLGVDLS
jgi:GH15 family glucan-1,4-alpha-glucosidase